MALFEEHLPDATIFSDEHSANSVKKQLAAAVKILQGPQEVLEEISSQKLQHDL